MNFRRLRIFYKSLIFTGLFFSVKPEEIIYKKNNISGREMAIYATLHGRTIGVIYYSVRRLRCCISLLDVDEKYQRQGIGSELMKRSLEDMKNNDCRSVELDSLESAKTFYTRFGFKCTHPFYDSRHMKYDFKQPNNHMFAMRFLEQFKNNYA